ncbi:MAG: hypothetical protein A2751_04545 [Candidatus Doudnabacteria bacterium RIFCSPHIGHO2_01_FULL_46_14]|uniref:Glycosyl transferase family 1 domain-containing protein n=1 Tax=Candidatus Doudnabacteria bacterium RIFCSPHIGHO2_01_FULL_46_14 TaxID=1817824 RepID=A0A1F5NNG8_9BACT|nr:MAG: hypothetical protein A2751_04545 [Candidatus Doudnabacteria bacterium RIFCSPHIGHO2_01_FULL_46_14]
MRIAIDIRALMEGKTTGIEVYLINLLNSLFVLDEKNEYILFANSFRKIDLPKFNHPNVKTIVTRYPNKFFNLAQKMGFPKIERLLGKIDLFFSPHWRVVALRETTPLVMTFHDLFFEIMPEFFTWRRRIWHWFMNYPTAAKRADKIIAVSESTKKDLVEMYGIEENKIEVIYPGVTPSTHSSPLKGEEEKPYFLYFGTFEPRKNIETVLMAYAAYYAQSKIKKSLIIAGSEGWKIKIAIPAGLRGKITVKKNVSEEEKSQLYQNAFAFIFPSFYEGFGFPILEAASFGLPVIASYNSSLAEIGKDFALFANPFRPEQFTNQMLRLEQDETFWGDLGDKGYRVAKNFEWLETARKTLQLFEEIAA